MDERVTDEHIERFLQQLITERGVSAYTARNYRPTLREFYGWHFKERGLGPNWRKLGRDDFRGYLRFLGRNNLSRSAIQLRFSALRSFYKSLIRSGAVATSPIKDIALPKLEKRLPRFATGKQMLDLLAAPARELARLEQNEAANVDRLDYLRDAAILETIYSCGLRISELCGLRAGDIDFNEQLVRVLGKGKKERLVPIGAPALEAIRAYWTARGTPGWWRAGRPEASSSRAESIPAPGRQLAHAAPSFLFLERVRSVRPTECPRRRGRITR